MKKAIDIIDSLIEKYEKQNQELQEDISEDFNPYDASGGNFDDAYQLGLDHAEPYAKLSVLRELLKEIKKNT